MLLRAIRVAAAAVLAAFSVLAAQGGAAAEPRLTVVELFTSQGCSSCPPADAHLADLAKRDDVLALGFHVDYWDYIGWTDQFGDPAHARRQRTYARGFGLAFVYTPQMIVDGIWQEAGYSRDKIAARITEAAALERPPIDIRLTRISDLEVHVRIPEVDYADTAKVLLIRYDASHETRVTRGENGGRRLVDYNVVRQILPIASWKGQAMDLSIPLEDLGDGGEYCAIILQVPGQGRIIAAGRVNMRRPAG